MGNPQISSLVRQLRDVMNGDLWIDETFEKKLAWVSAANAFIQPLSGFHSVAEILSHIIVWRRINIRRLQGEKVVMAVEDCENWRTNEELRAQSWEALLADFNQSQQDLIAVFEHKGDGYLDTVSTHYGKSFGYLLEGMVHHDVYHLGQLGLTIKFLPR